MLGATRAGVCGGGGGGGERGGQQRELCMWCQSTFPTTRYQMVTSIHYTLKLHNYIHRGAEGCKGNTLVMS